jgi:hypothetical protein
MQFPTLLELVNLVAGLAGFGAFIATFVNTLKTFKVVKDGNATAWVTGLNMLLVVGLFVSKLLGYEVPGDDLILIDGIMGQIAEIGQMILALVVQVYASKKTHELLRGAPVIGKSFSYDQIRREERPVARTQL